MTSNAPKHDLAEFTVDRLCGPDEDSPEEGRAQLEFMNALTDFFRAVGVDATMADLNRKGHAFRDVPEAAAGWRIFREPGADGRRELQVAVEEETGDLMITTPLSDTAWEAMLEARRAPLSDAERAAESLRERFYARGGELFVQRFDAPDGLGEQDRMVMDLYVLDTEINNGGFAQYFDNTGGRDAERAAGELGVIGANSARGLVERAIALVGGPFGRELDARQSEAVDACAGQLGELDDAWYGLEDDIALLAMRHCVQDDNEA